MNRFYYKNYNKTIAKQRALGCKTRSEFIKRHPTAYRWAKNNGLLVGICAHMVPKLVLLTKWTEETIKDEAKNFLTIKEFSRESNRAYRQALKINKIKPNYMKNICEHMLKVKRPAKFKHTKKSAFKIAKKYKVLQDFYIARRDIHAFLRRQGFYEEATKHMIKKKGKSIQEILNIISKYDYWDEFKKNEPSFFNAIKASPSLNKKFFVPKFIKERSHPLSWSKRMVIEEMRKYKTNKEFLKNKPAAYQRALTLNLIESKFDPINKRRKWNRKNLLNLCKKYSSWGELIIKEGNSPINAAYKLGIKLPISKVQYCGETYLKYFLEKVLEIPLEKRRPLFLKSPRTGRNLELDGFNKKHSIAFEHCGNYHRKASFGRSLDDIMYRDKLKIRLCKKNRIKLIITKDIIYDYKMNETLIKKIIRKQLTKMNIPYNKEKFEKSIIFNKRVKIKRP